jgi:hypothetical protein
LAKKKLKAKIVSDKIDFDALNLVPEFTVNMSASTD